MTDPEKNQKDEAEGASDISSQPESPREVRREHVPSSVEQQASHPREEHHEEIETVRQSLRDMGKREVVITRDVSKTATGQNALQERISAYQSRYLPPYLRGPKGIIGTWIMERYGKSVSFESHGVENIPEHGPFLVVCNHFGGGEVEALTKTFAKYNIHNIGQETPAF